MIRRRSVLAAAILTVFMASCGRDFFDPTPDSIPTEAPTVELVAKNIRLLDGAEHALRIGFVPRDGSARIRVERATDGGRIAACPLTAVDGALPEPDSCHPDVPDGVRESVAAAGLNGIAFIRTGDPVTISVRLEFEERERRISMHIPLIAVPAGTAACKDNACNPFFELLPLRSGAFMATAAWSGGAGRLQLLEGRVLARALTSTGIPYRIAASDEGTAPLQIRATLDAPGEYALALSNLSSGDLTRIAIDAAWP